MLFLTNFLYWVIGVYAFFSWMCLQCITRVWITDEYVIDLSLGYVVITNARIIEFISNQKDQRCSLLHASHDDFLEYDLSTSRQLNLFLM